MPTGHVQRVNSVAFCGASIEPKDFAFKDLDHARDHYGPDNKFLRACPNCLAAARFEAARAKE